MKYELTENIKKAIKDFDELLKKISEIKQMREDEKKEMKQKLEYALSLIKEMEG
jgi:hypothetical protein